MIPAIRAAFNAAFTQEKYDAFYQACHDRFHKKIEFKVCETPVFIPADFRDQVFAAGESILDVICAPGFNEISRKAIPDEVFVPGDEGRSTFIALDFGICENEKGELVPQLIEMQGFASLYGWQHELGIQYKNHFPIPDTVSHLFSGLDDKGYIELFRATILGGYDPAEVILLEIEPEKQKTWIDFYLTREMLGIEPVCISDIIKEGEQLFYLKDGVKTRIRRIYNRLIFDELLLRKDLQRQWNLIEPAEVEWVCHPNWFFRISKYSLPFIQSPYVPATYFISHLKEIPQDLENWVLKPLFSFAGHGVIFNVTPEDIEKVRAHGEHFILQRKVQYKSVIETLDQPAKCELRLMYIWEPGKARPTLVTNLARLSKGVMIGVDYNKNKTWVGGTVGFYER